MSVSNNRVHEFRTVHHLTSRIAHRVYFLGDEERTDLVAMMRRAAAFGGINLLGWCVMTNHFHVLAYLPQPMEVDEGEALRRYGILKGEVARCAAENQLAEWRARNQENLATAWLDALRRRMYDIGAFMKTVKQWFTEEYNRRTSHVGTLWESAYRDHVIPTRVKDMSRVLGYIHLNPIRAAASDRFDGYAWSSFAALAKGDEVALAGMRFVYDDDAATASELMDRHTVLLDAFLEGVKRTRAEEIARKRAAGLPMPIDHLTSEAMVAQAAAHVHEVQNALVRLHQEADTAKMERVHPEVGASRLLAVLVAHPMAGVDELAQSTGYSLRSVYRLLRYLKGNGQISRLNSKSPWQLVAR